MVRTSKIFTDDIIAASLLPKRAADSNKGSFGKALLITGSKQYEGAGRLSLEAALRGGCGIVTFLSTNSLRDRLISDFPEAIYAPLLDNISEELPKIKELSEKHDSVLVGSGSGISEELLGLIRELSASEGCPLVLDADALNSIARYSDSELIKNSRRQVIITPHVLEFSRLTGIEAESINQNREVLAQSFAQENNCIVLLKGKDTVITDGRITYINKSGSNALSKGGSGDVLAGLLVSMLAFHKSPLQAAALSAYIHGRAADTLSETLSHFGVTPSDLPMQMARQICILEKTEG